MCRRLKREEGGHCTSDFFCSFQVCSNFTCRGAFQTCVSEVPASVWRCRQPRHRLDARVLRRNRKKKGRTGRAAQEVQRRSYTGAQRRSNYPPAPATHHPPAQAFPTSPPRRQRSPRPRSRQSLFRRAQAFPVPGRTGPYRRSLHPRSRPRQDPDYFSQARTWESQQHVSYLSDVRVCKRSLRLDTGAPRRNRNRKAA